MTHPAIFQRTRTVEDHHVDPLGHVNNVVWVDLIVDLAVAHSTSLGLTFDATRELGGIWVIRRHEVDYHDSALPGEEILEETWVRSLRGARSVRHSRFTRPSDGTRLVSAITHWAYLDALTQRPRRIDAPILAAFKTLEELP